MKSVSVDVRYEAGHTYQETWHQTDFFCPLCGLRKVWDEDSAGDYYLGTTLTCAACGGTFHFPSDARLNWQVQQRIGAFIEAEARP